MASAGAAAVGTVVVDDSAATESTEATETTAVEDALAHADADPVLVPTPPLEPVVLLPVLAPKLSIYPSPTPTLVLVDTPSPLELTIGQVRREVCGRYSGARTRVQSAIDGWIRVEQAVESRIKSFQDPNERLTPGILYTSLAALTSSILVRSRPALVRSLLVPPLAFVGAFAWFLPRTAGRVGAWVGELEDAYAPSGFGEARRAGVVRARGAVEGARERYREGVSGLGEGARNVVERVESGTGLRLSGALGWSTTARTDEDEKTGSGTGSETRTGTGTGTGENGRKDSDDETGTTRS